jgi:hypothetical protein
MSKMCHRIIMVPDKDIIGRYVLANAIFSLGCVMHKEDKKISSQRDFFSTKNYLFYA